MDARRIVTGVLVMVFLLVGLSMAVPATSEAAKAKSAGTDAKTMWCNIPNEQFYTLCNDKEFMKGLTPQQKKAIDKEWQRRVPNMTPAEVEKYYPAGQRYYQGG